MVRKIISTLISSGTRAPRGRRHEILHTVTFRRSVATNVLPRRAIETQVVDDIKAYPPTFEGAGPRLKHVKKDEEALPLSHAYVGMTGGQIFHEMMLQHGIKCICVYLA